MKRSILNIVVAGMLLVAMNAGNVAFASVTTLNPYEPLKSNPAEPLMSNPNEPLVSNPHEPLVADSGRPYEP